MTPPIEPKVKDWKPRKPTQIQYFGMLVMIIGLVYAFINKDSFQKETAINNGHQAVHSFLNVQIFALNCKENYIHVECNGGFTARMRLPHHGRISSGYRKG